MGKKYDNSKVWAKNHRINENGRVERYCSVCGKWKEENVINFYLRNKSKPEKGFSSECKECCIARSTKWIKNHPTKYKQIMKKVNKREDRNDYRREWSDKNRKNGKRKEYENNNKEKFKGYQEKHNKKKHLIIDKEWIACKEFFDNACAYCGLPIEEHYKLINNKIVYYDLDREHVIDDGKNDLSNCIPSCSICNDNKRQKPFNYFYNPKNLNYTYERYYKIYLWLRYEYKKYIQPKRRYKGQRYTSRLKEIEESKNIKKNQHKFLILL